MTGKPPQANRVQNVFHFYGAHYTDRDGVIQETLRYFKEKPPQLWNWMQMLVSGGSREPDRLFWDYELWAESFLWKWN